MTKGDGQVVEGSKGRRYLVTGGGGFLGKALSRELLKHGAFVRSVARKYYAELEELGVESHQLDLAFEHERLIGLCEGIDVVFHVAAKVDMWGPYREFFAVNVGGTRAILAACQAAGVKRLVYTSSPSVIASGGDLRGVNEDHPYPDHYDAHYPATKAIAEQEVLAAHNSAGLRTIALRPHLIFGPGDTNLLPTIIERARAGRLVRVGDGDNLVDLCFIEDCVRAHLLAAEALEHNPSVGGKPYFISQGEPVKLWDWIDEVLSRNHLPPVQRGVPLGMAVGLASLLELGSKLRPGRPEPLFTRFLAREMATSHYFDISRARSCLGYEPQYSMAQALDCTFPPQIANRSEGLLQRGLKLLGRR